MNKTDKSFIPGIKKLIGEIISDELHLQRRGLFLEIIEVKILGKLIDKINIWANLHYLILGSPFCCNDPYCHLSLFDEEINTISEILRKKLNLKQTITMNVIEITNIIHDGVEFDDEFQGITPFNKLDINAQDNLGRTALMRAVIRGYSEQVKALVDSGADIKIKDNSNKSPYDLVMHEELPNNTSSEIISIIIGNSI